MLLLLRFLHVGDRSLCILVVYRPDGVERLVRHRHLRGHLQDGCLVYQIFRLYSTGRNPRDNKLRWRSFSFLLCRLLRFLSLLSRGRRHIDLLLNVEVQNNTLKAQPHQDVEGGSQVNPLTELEVHSALSFILLPPQDLLRAQGLGGVAGDLDEVRRRMLLIEDILGRDSCLLPFFFLPISPRGRRRVWVFKPFDLPDHQSQTELVVSVCLASMPLLCCCRFFVLRRLLHFLHFRLFVLVLLRLLVLILSLVVKDVAVIQLQEEGELRQNSLPVVRKEDNGVSQ
mmetsp:Transcript_34735/g.78442  ORF Transcript_34735/g.78442 Transcript_34735/m.78442 type:complete len:284 (+) Transcript_34735:1461-2312(+)